MIFPVLAAVVFWSAILGGGAYFLRRFVRAAEQRSAAPSELFTLRDRVAALEAALEETRSDIRQLSEGQEFTARLLDTTTARGKSAT